MSHSRFLRLVSLLAISMMALAITGCNGSSGGSASAKKTGQMSLAVTDAPIDGARSVVIVFNGVEIHGPGGTKTFTFDPPKRIDLLEFQGSDAAVLLDPVTLKAGNYQYIRLNVDVGSSYITLDDGSRHKLFIPSGAQTGLKLVSGFTVAAGELVNFTIDFNLRKSIHRAPGHAPRYMLKPALQLVNNVNVGTIKGSVVPTLKIGSKSITDPACGAAVYLYTADVTPGDVNTRSSAENQPIDSARLRLDKSTGRYDFVIGFVAKGDYTLAVTCGKLDDPDADDTLSFAATQTVSVTPDENTVVSLR